MAKENHIMNKFIVSLLLLLSFTSVQAEDIPEVQIQQQQFDQNLCVQQSVERCTGVRCPDSKDDNCIQICTEMAKNECRYAGE